MAASRYPEIEKVTTSSGDLIDIGGSARHYHNTNRLVGNKDWGISLSKTGFTNEAGRCIIMRVHAARRNAIIVLLNARQTSNRTADAISLRRLLMREPRPEVVAGLSLK